MQSNGTYITLHCVRICEQFLTKYTIETEEGYLSVTYIFPTGVGDGVVIEALLGGVTAALLLLVLIIILLLVAIAYLVKKKNCECMHVCVIKYSLTML